VLGREPIPGGTCSAVYCPGWPWLSSWTRDGSERRWWFALDDEIGDAHAWVRGAGGDLVVAGERHALFERPDARLVRLHEVAP